jgi:hypothetical protein
MSQEVIKPPAVADKSFHTQSSIAPHRKKKKKKKEKKAIRT